MLRELQFTAYSSWAKCWLESCSLEAKKSVTACHLIGVGLGADEHPYYDRRTIRLGRPEHVECAHRQDRDQAAADQSHSAEDRAFLAERAARFRMLARLAEEKAKARRLN